MAFSIRLPVIKVLDKYPLQPLNNAGRVSTLDWPAKESDGSADDSVFGKDFFNRFTVSLCFRCWNGSFLGISTKQSSAYDKQTYASSNGICFIQNNHAQTKIQVKKKTHNKSKAGHILPQLNEITREVKPHTMSHSDAPLMTYKKYSKYFLISRYR